MVSSMKRRVNHTPKPELSIWKQEGKLYRADPKELLTEIDKHQVPMDEMKRRMGHGFHYVADALEGKALDIWAVKHIELGILPEKTHNYHPPGYEKK